MKNTVLLFESRDLCYESNRYFVECMAEAFEAKGYPAEICDLSVRMEEKLEHILDCREKYLLAVDFNSLLPRAELSDKTPYLKALGIPFYNYLVDHPLYHHAALKKTFPGYSILCIDACHQKYIQTYYPHIRNVICLPLGAMRAGMERDFGQKRLDLLFLGTYEPEEKLYQELLEYPLEKKQEIAALIEQMESDPGLAQEDALAQYLKDCGAEIKPEESAKRLNEDYLADKYLRNKNRKRAVLAAAESKVPFTVIGHGWECLEELGQAHIKRCGGIGFAASLQVMADAKMLLNSTPGFHGGLHDRVYSAMINHTLCFTEDGVFAKQKLENGALAVLYDVKKPHELAEKIAYMHGHPKEAWEIAGRAFQKTVLEDTWEKRVEELYEKFSFQSAVFGV